MVEAEEDEAEGSGRSHLIELIQGKLTKIQVLISWEEVQCCVCGYNCAY